MTRFHSRRSSTTVTALLGAVVLATFAPGAAASGAFARTSLTDAKKSLEYVVPAGVTSITVDMAGATGRDPFCSLATGRAAR